MKNTFWFVWCEPYGVPKYKHASEQSAYQEAERLAKKHKGLTFTVLQSIADCQVTDVQWTTHEQKPSDLPF